MLVESQGVEPCGRISTTCGLANRCITVLPTLHVLVWVARFELATSEFQARPSDLADNIPSLNLAERKGFEPLCHLRNAFLSKEAD